MYIADGDYIKDIEVNDLRNRYTLTKGATQKMVNIPVKSADNARHRQSCFFILVILFVDVVEAYKTFLA